MKILFLKTVLIRLLLTTKKHKFSIICASWNMNKIGKQLKPQKSVNNGIGSLVKRMILTGFLHSGENLGRNSLFPN